MALIIPTSWSYQGGSGAVGVNGSRISVINYRRSLLCTPLCEAITVHHVSRTVAIQTPGCFSTIALGASFSYWGITAEFSTGNIDRLKDLLIRDTPARNGRTIIGVNTAIARSISSNRAPQVDS